MTNRQGDSGFPSLIDLLLTHGGDEGLDGELVPAFAAYEASVRASARTGDGSRVKAVESAVRADPPAAFSFDASGGATLTAAGGTWRAGRFETFSIGELRARVASVPKTSAARIRLSVLEGESPATDIGSLQARADGDTLFQVASQFNCLEAMGPRLASVESYFGDPTQGPRASISAFPGTLLRHYHAPDRDGGRFVQTNDGAQIELLRDVCEAGVATVQNGYLQSHNISDTKAFSAILDDRFDAIRVGVHDDVEVVLGHAWHGAVDGPRRVSQVFTSTLAAKGYGSAEGPLVDVCRQLLRAAYLGTLLAAANLGQRRVVLSLIGGGAFGNPPSLIWDSILWALTEADSFVSGDLDVVVNGRDIGDRLNLETIARAARERGGVLLSCPSGGPASIQR